MIGKFNRGKTASDALYQHRDAEITRAVEAYRAAVLAADRGTGPTPEAASPVVSPGRDALIDSTGGADAISTSETTRVGPAPVRAGLGSINAYQHNQLVALIRWIESDTLLRTEDQLIGEALVALLSGHVSRASGPLMARAIRYSWSPGTPVSAI